jgi:predicted metalloprotease
MTSLGNKIGRGLSANYAVLNPKLRKFENLIYRLKKILDAEKKSLRQVKTLCSKEIEQKNFLEKILRQCVDDVKNEIQKKRTEGKVQYYQKPAGGV